MPKGHKIDCQCSICKSMRNKTSEAPPPIAALEPAKPPDGITAGTLSVGQRFYLKGECYQSGITDGGIVMAISLDRPHLGRQMIDPGTTVFLEK